jgi:outer membrane protein TolC
MKSARFILLVFVFLAAWMPSGFAADTPAAASSDTYSFNRCIQIASEHNAEIRDASTQFIAANGKVLQLRAILYPQVDVQALTTPMDIYVQVNQVIYNRATFPQLRLGRLTEEQAFINYRQTLNDVVFQVRQAFAAVLAASERVEKVRKFSGEKFAAIKSAQQLFDAGQVQKSVITNIQVQAGLSKRDLANDELTYTQAKLALENILGQTLPESARFVGDFSTKLPENLDTGALIGEALRDREDLKLLESLKLSAEQKIQIDVKNVYPMVGFSSNSTIQPPATAFSNDFNAEANFNEPQTAVGAGQTQLPLSLYLTWVLFDGGNVRGVKMSDNARIATQDIAISELKQSITGEIGGAVSRIVTQRKSLQAMQDQPSPEELRKLAETSYQAGDIRQLDKVNLENDLLTQELLELSTQYQLCLAAAALDHALGHGLNIIQSAAPAPHN